MITVSEKAASKFQSILADNNLSTDTPVRVYLKGGGCSGFEVKIEVEENQPGKMDLTFESQGVTIVIDKKSNMYLNGMTVDWDGDIMGGFKFDPPDATGSCGCGVSFAFQ